MTIIIGIILAIFLSLILVSKKSKSLSDKILLAWLIAIAITLILFKLQTVEARYDYPYLLGWSFPLPLLQWPFLYLYVLSLTSIEPFRTKMFLHFLPFILSILLFSKYLFLPNETKIDIYNMNGVGYETEMNINLIAIILSAIAYTILSSLQLWKHKQNINSEFSYTDKITLNWLLYLIIGMTCLLLIILLGGNDNIIFSSITGVVLYIGYFGIKQKGIFNENLKMESAEISQNGITIESHLDSRIVYSNDYVENSLLSEKSPKTETVKYNKTKLSDNEITSIHKRLMELMEEEKLYKHPEISLSDVAQKIPIHPNALSQVINTVEEKNFYDYINSQRVKEFQRIVLQPKSNQFTLLTLACESGFNSKTSFNRNFKKVTNQTPSEFLRQKNIQLPD
jgi:AraC-like DNA-binding protein